MPRCLRQDDIERLRAEGPPSRATSRPKVRGSAGGASESADASQSKAFDAQKQKLLKSLSEAAGDLEQRQSKHELYQKLCMHVDQKQTAPEPSEGAKEVEGGCRFDSSARQRPSRLLETSLTRYGPSPKNSAGAYLNGTDAAVARRVSDFVRKGTSAYVAGHLQDALGFFTAGLELNPGHAVLYNNRSACYLRLGMAAEALKDAVTCISFGPQWWKGWLRKGEALHDLHHLDASIEAVQNGIRLEPNSQELFSIMERLQEEAAILGREMTFRSHDPVAGCPHRSANFHQSDSDSDAQHPGGILSAEEYRERGNSAHLESRFRTAIQCYTVALCLSPHESVLLNNRSKSYFDSGDFHRSLMDAELCIAVRPEWFRGWLRAALAMIKLNMMR